MSRTLRLAFAALALTMAQASHATASMKSVSKPAVAELPCSEKTGGSFTKRAPQKTNTVIAKLMTGAGDNALETVAPRAKQSGTAR